jgi:small-conductance mechanosensitive channel
LTSDLHAGTMRSLVDDFLLTQIGWMLALGICLLLLVLRKVMGDDTLRRDVRGAVLYFAGYLPVHLVADGLEARGLGSAARAFRILSYLLFAFGVIAAGDAIGFYVVRSRAKVPTPKILRDVTNGLLYLFAVAVILRVTMQVDLGSLLATSAVLSVVIGLALQETIGNLFAGLSLQVERPFYVGDWITVGPHTGKVVNVAWRATRIVTLRHEYITIPNSIIAKESVINYTRNREGFATDLYIDLGYDVPPHAACDLCLGAILEHPQVKKDPPPLFRAYKYEASGVQYQIRVHFNDFPDHETVRHEILSLLWYRLKRARFTIPFPTRTVYMQSPSQGEEARLEEERDIARLLSHVDFLRPLGDEGLLALAQRSTRLVYGKGEVIIRQGDAGDTFYVIMSGEVSVNVGTPGALTELARLRRGDFMGEMSLLTAEPRAATVVVTRDASLLVVSRESFSDLLHSNEALARGISEALASRREHLRSAAAGSAAADVQAMKVESNRIFARLRDIFSLR